LITRLEAIVDSTLWALLGLAFLLVITPGQDTMLVLRNVMLRGKFAGIATGVGACCGLFVHATLSVCGLSAVLLYSATAFSILKGLGACYLVYLGVRSLWGAWRGEALPDGLGMEGVPLLRGNMKQLRKAFGEGFMSNVLNPKVVVFYLAVLPQVIGDPALIIRDTLFFVGFQFVIAVIYLTLLSMFLGRVRHVLLRPAFKRKLETVTGTVMVGFGVRLALEQTP
jgi:threonine/homoserine/homoserine lactone efflux protein